MPSPTAATAALTTLLCLAAPAAADVLVVVDKATQNMTVSVDGEPVHNWPVSTGMAGHSTPVGSYGVLRMVKDHRSREWDDAPMPHSLFFTERGHAIHGSGAVRRLGRPASHGCVRLAPDNARTLFELVKAQGRSGVRVVVEGVEPSGPAPELVARRPAPRPRPAARLYEEDYAYSGGLAYGYSAYRSRRPYGEYGP